MDIIFSVCNRTSLPHALALAASLKEYEPEKAFFLGWADTGMPSDVPEQVKFISVDELQIPGWEDMQRQYFPFELVPACRPHFALEILSRNPACTSLTFLAPTVKVFASINLNAGDAWQFLLTPHLHKPLPADKLLDDKRILNIGMFHSGSWAMKPELETIKTLHWWAKRTIDRAEYDLCNAMATDQLWLNYVPVWISDTLIVGHTGWHYGLHAVLNHKLEKKGENLAVDGNPLISIDFAGLDFFDPLWSDYKALLSACPELKMLFAGYRKQLAAFRQAAPKDPQSGYGKPVHIPENRLTRKKLVRQLKSVTDLIDKI